MTSFHAFSKKKENKTKQCRFETTLFLLLLPLDVQQGKRSFLFSSLYLFLSLSRALLEPKPDTTAEKSCPTSDAPIGHLSRRCDKAGERCAPSATMGRDRVNPAPPAPINTIPKGEERRKEKGGGRKRETTVFFRGEGDRKKELEGFFFREKRRDREREITWFFFKRRKRVKRKRSKVEAREKKKTGEIGAGKGK